MLACKLFQVQIPIKIIEASPDTLTDSHIDLFRKYNFTTVSIGVQTFSSALLKKQAQPFLYRLLVCLW